MIIAFGGGASKDELGSTAWAAAPTVTNADLMPRTMVNSSATRVVMTTWTQENLPAPWHPSGTGEPGWATGGEFTVTLLLKPAVAPQPRPPTSNQEGVNDELLDRSHAVL